MWPPSLNKLPKPFAAFLCMYFEIYSSRAVKTKKMSKLFFSYWPVKLQLSPSFIKSCIFSYYKLSFSLVKNYAQRASRTKKNLRKKAYTLTKLNYYPHKWMETFIFKNTFSNNLLFNWLNYPFVIKYKLYIRFYLIV